MIAFLKVASGLFRRREFLAAFASPDLLHNGAAAYRVAVYVMLAAASETSVKSGYGSHLLFMCGRLSGLSRHFSHGLAFTVGRRVEYQYGGIARYSAVNTGKRSLPRERLRLHRRSDRSGFSRLPYFETYS